MSFYRIDHTITDILHIYLLNLIKPFMKNGLYIYVNDTFGNCNRLVAKHNSVTSKSFMC